MAAQGAGVVGAPGEFRNAQHHVPHHRNRPTRSATTATREDCLSRGAPTRAAPENPNHKDKDKDKDKDNRPGETPPRDD